MIEIHHLNHSRSQRILWMLEELGLDYKIIPYQREPNRLAPPSLKAIHPLGKSPVIRDDGAVIAESAAIVEYLVRKYDKEGRLAPPVDPNSAEWRAWNHWMHFAEGSAMLPLMLKLYVGRLGEAGAPLAPRIDSELKNHFDYMEGALADQDYFVGNRFTAADIMLSFVLDAGAQRGGMAQYPRLTALHARLKARPAYQRALEKGGPYELGR